MCKVVIFVMLLFCTGCSVDFTEENLSKVHFVKTEQEIGDKTPEERALAVKNRLKQLDDVIGTAVVVEGHTAIIGLRLKEGMEQSQIDSVRREADIAAKAAGVSVESTSVTANHYIVSLIEDMERKRAG